MWGGAGGIQRTPERDPTDLPLMNEVSHYLTAMPASQPESATRRECGAGVPASERATP